MKSADPPIVVEQHFEISRDTVWKAITEPVRMRQWFFENIKDFKPEVGFETQFAVEVEDRTFTHHWKITEVTPQQKLTINWTYDEYPGDSFVTFELLEEENCTRLKLTHEITESFPESIPEFSRESCLGGWIFFIQKSLEDYLSQTTEASIRHFYQQWFTAMEKADTDRLLGLLAKDFYFKGPGQPAATDEAILRKGLEQFHEAFSETVEWEIEELHIFNTNAVVRIAEAVTMVSRETGESSRMEGVHLSLLVKNPDGEWQLKTDVSSLNHPV